MTPFPLTRDLVLIGGGHTHALVLKHFGMHPVAGVNITVINPGPTAPYTGMLPGHIAGHYTRAELEIDLYRLSRFAGARLITDIAGNVDLARREVHLTSGRRIAYDIASLDIGVTSTLFDMPGFEDHGIPAKPLGPLAGRWQAFLEAGGGDDIVVIGGGVAGVELALAMNYRLKQERPGARVTLLEKGNALAALPQSSAARLRQRLDDAGVLLREGVGITGLSKNAVHLAEGEDIPSAFTISAAGAQPHSWLGDTGLVLEDGYVRVDGKLQTSDEAVFAAGDCAYLSHAPRPKAGVFAVRAAPVLATNLTAALTGGQTRQFNPQKDYLKLVSLGGKDALGEKAGIGLSGPWVWQVKDRIDRAFMNKLNQLTPMQSPGPTGAVAQDVHEIMDKQQHLCGACGAKVGIDTLHDALGSIGDDAATYDIGGTPRVATTDLLNAFTGDPFLMGQIAAVHAMGDVWAMGGTPDRALAQITLPRMSGDLQARWLSEVSAGARAAFAPEDVEIIGGHTTQGSGFQVGFTVLGEAPSKPIEHGGARSGDALILTRPLGSGVLLAADMRLLVDGNDLTALFATMSRSQGDAARVLNGAHAMTDVTGFGLAGHLTNILKASDLSATIVLDQIPLFNGAADLSAKGVRSSLWEANRAAVNIELADHPAAEILFDPQTAGGLLAAVDESSSNDVVGQLKELGHNAARIGSLHRGTPKIKAT